MLSAIGFGSYAFGRTFRFYSIVSIVMLLIFGVLTAFEAPDIDQPTPMIGVWERINIGIFLLWVIVVSIVLLTRKEQI